MKRALPPAALTASMTVAAALRVAPGDDHLGAFACEPLGDCAADA